MKNREWYIELFEIYGKLFTKKQKLVFEYYFFEDLTLDEIAAELNITKSAVSDSIKKTKESLEYYEDIIHALDMNKRLKGE